MDTRRSPRRGFTLVELLVVIAIIGILVARLLPAIQAARVAARRNQCLSQIRQLAIAIQNHHDTRKGLPLASTAPFRQGTNFKIKYGTEGTASNTATIVATPGQQGDGYSWIVQCLPFMEEQPLYDKITQLVTTNRPLGKLNDPAFSANKDKNALTTPGGSNAGDTTNPYCFNQKIEVLRCPSYPGEDEVALTGFLTAPTTPTTAKVGAGNYIAMVATHFATNGELQNGTSPPSKDCASGAYCGNGSIVFPGLTGTNVTKLGLGLQSLTDGTSKTVILAESREERWTSWYSGLASYGVAAWPQGAAPTASATNASNPVAFWVCLANSACDTSLNKGDTKDDATALTKWYQKNNNHAQTPAAPQGGRAWGPSSRHPGVVQHGYGDGHGGAVTDTIDKNAYLALVTRSGRETTTE